MGESIEQTVFDKGQSEEFRRRLRSETLYLKKLLESRALPYHENSTVGLEVEAWLLDQNYLPNPINREFLNQVNDDAVVEELAQFNFEINSPPETLQPGTLHRLQSFLENQWSNCQAVGKKLNTKPLLVGIPPLIRDEMLQLDYMSDGGRYLALNKQILELRGGKPALLQIKGLGELDIKLDQIMMEAAATSIQVHLQANQENFCRVYNASQLASAPLVAVAANSPFLFGESLWDETRIPLFEKIIGLTSFRNKKGHDVGRVGMGTGYLKRSPLEIFLENLDGHPVLVPILFDSSTEELRHLNFHNGTIWRWTRAIVAPAMGASSHFRIEQRVMASGPSLADIVANTSFCIGLILSLAGDNKPPEESLTFTDCESNFYQAAEKGLQAQVTWNGKSVRMDQLLLNEFIPRAQKGLHDSGIPMDEVNEFMTNIIHQRVLKGQTGAQWQRSFIDCHGKDFQSLTEEYLNRQDSGEPVHLWKI